MRALLQKAVALMLPYEDDRNQNSTGNSKLLARDEIRHRIEAPKAN